MIFAKLQYLLPKKLLSRLVGIAAKTENRLVSQLFIGLICLFYPINLQEAARTRRQDYRSFNDFFTRRLRDGIRPVSGLISSPADGTVASLGEVTEGTLIQAKGQTYLLSELLAQSDVTAFEGGSFITIYLAPHNYHRVHAPVSADLHSATYVPGDLFSVSRSTARHIPNLFARNERLVCRFRGERGPMAAVLVGAMIVAGIKPVWLDEPYRPGLGVTTEMKQSFVQGEELGQFEMGSTVVLVFSDPVPFNVAEGDTVQYGQPIA